MMDSSGADANENDNPFANIRNIRWRPFQLEIFHDIIKANGLAGTHSRKNDDLSRFAADAMKRMQFEKYRSVPRDTGEDTYEFIKDKVEKKLRRMINDIPTPGTRKSKRLAGQDPLSPKTTIAVPTLHAVKRKDTPIPGYRGSPTPPLENLSRCSPDVHFEASESPRIPQERPLARANDVEGSVGIQSERAGNTNNLEGISANVIGQTVETNSILGDGYDADAQDRSLGTNQTILPQRMIPSQECNRFPHPSATTLQNHYKADIQDTSLRSHLPQQIIPNQERVSTSNLNSKSNNDAGAGTQSGRYDLLGEKVRMLPETFHMNRMNQKSFRAQENDEQIVPSPLRIRPKKKEKNPRFEYEIFNNHDPNSFTSQLGNADGSGWGREVECQSQGQGQGQGQDRGQDQLGHPSSGYPPAQILSSRGYEQQDRDRFPGQSSSGDNLQRAEQHPVGNPRHSNLQLSNDQLIDKQHPNSYLNSHLNSHLNSQLPNSQHPSHATQHAIAVLNSKHKYTPLVSQSGQPSTSSLYRNPNPNSYTTIPKPRPNHDYNHEQNHHACVQDESSSQSRSGTRMMYNQHQQQGQDQSRDQNDDFSNLSLPGRFSSFSPRTSGGGNSSPRAGAQTQMQNMNRDKGIQIPKSRPDFRDRRLSVSDREGETQYRGQNPGLGMHGPEGQLQRQSQPQLQSMKEGVGGYDYDYDLRTLSGVSSRNSTTVGVGVGVGEGDGQYLFGQGQGYGHPNQHPHQFQQTHQLDPPNQTPEIMHENQCKIAEEKALAEFEMLRQELERRMEQILRGLHEGYGVADRLLGLRL